MEEIKAVYKSKSDKAGALRSTIDALNEGLLRLRSVSKEPKRVVSTPEEKIDVCTGDNNVSDAAEFTDAHAAAVSKKESNTIETKGMDKQRTKHIAQLEEQIRNQELVILERGEEKREAIQQLSFSMDVLQSKNQRLELMMGALKKKLHASNAHMGQVFDFIDLEASLFSG